MGQNIEVRFAMDEDVLGGMKYSLKSNNNAEVVQTALRLLHQALTEAKQGRQIVSFDALLRELHPIGPSELTQVSRNAV